MPKIRTYEQQIGSPGVINARRASAEDFGSGAFGAVAEGMKDYADFLRKKALADADFESKKDYIQIETDWQEHFKKAQESAPEGAVNFTEDLLKQYDESMNTYWAEKKFPEEVRREAELRLMQHRSILMQSAMSFESSSRAALKKRQVADVGNDISRQIYLNPDSYLDKVKQYASVAGSVGDPDLAGALRAQNNPVFEAMAIKGLVDQRRLEEAEKAIKEAQHISGEQAMSLTNAVQAERKALETEARARKSEAVSAIGSVRDRMSLGLEIPEEELAEVESLVRGSGDTEITRSYQNLVALQADTELWRTKYTPADLEQVITGELLPALHAGGASEMEMDRYQVASSLLDSMRKQIAANPLNFAAEQGLVEITPVSPEDPVSLSRRDAQAQAAGEIYGSSGFFLPAELDQVSQNWRNMSPIQKVQFVTSIRANAPKTYPLAFAQIGEKNAPFDTYVASMAAADPRLGEVAEKAFIGKAIMTEDPSRKPKADVFGMAFSDYVGNAFSFYSQANPQIGAVTTEVAQALAVADNQDPENGKFDGYVRLAVGGSLEDKETGIADINGARTILPPGVRRSEFNTFVESEADWKALAGSYPFDSSMRPVMPEELAEDGQFFLVSPGRYVVVLASDGRPLLNEQGGYYTVNITSEIIRGGQ